MGSLRDSKIKLLRRDSGEFPEFQSAEAGASTVSGGLMILNQSGETEYVAGLSTEVNRGPDGKPTPKEVAKTLDQSDNGKVTFDQSSCSAGRPLSGSQRSSTVGSVKITVGGGGERGSTPPQVCEDRPSQSCSYKNDDATTKCKAPPQAHFYDPDPKFKITVKGLTGKSNLYWVRRSDTVESLQRLVSEKLLVPSEHQQLVYGGRSLNKDTTLDKYNICENSVIHMVARMRGGNA